MMRTTLTIAPDVAAEIERRRRDRGTGLKQEIDELLRAGLAFERDKPASRGRFVPRTLSCGDPRIADVDDVSELLAVLEGDAFK